MTKNFASVVMVGLAFSSFLFASPFARGASTKSQSAPPVIHATPAAGAPATAPSMAVAEDWKGPAETAQWNLGALTGLGIINATPGWAIMGVVSRKLLDHGFVPDINNSVWLEAELGPVIAKGSAGFQFSGHIRWDFVKDDDWTLYAIGGIGGGNTGEKLGNKFELYPRFAAGALWKIFADFNLRGELSHELIVVGPQFDF